MDTNQGIADLTNHIKSNPPKSIPTPKAPRPHQTPKPPKEFDECWDTVPCHTFRTNVAPQISACHGSPWHPSSAARMMFSLAVSLNRPGKLYHPLPPSASPTALGLCPWVHVAYQRTIRHLCKVAEMVGALPLGHRLHQRPPVPLQGTGTVGTLSLAPPFHHGAAPICGVTKVHPSPPSVQNGLSPTPLQGVGIDFSSIRSHPLYLLMGWSTPWTPHGARTAIAPESSRTSCRLSPRHKTLNCVRLGIPILGGFPLVVPCTALLVGPPFGPFAVPGW